MPSVLTPQLWEPPAVTALKVPAGGRGLAGASLPQQASVPSVFTPQLWEPPAETELKVPAGRRWPDRSCCRPSRRGCRSSSPRSCGSRRRETELKVPAGGLAWPESLSPQQASVPSVLHPAAVGAAGAERR